MRLSQIYVHANGDDVRTWRKSSNPKTMIATAAYITLGEHNLTVIEHPGGVRVGVVEKVTRSVVRWS
jgi:hypothetical protein